MVVLVPRDWIALLKRMAYDALLRWKAAAKRKVLLVDGARQIGKTFLIEEFARNEYASYIKIDFLNDARAVELLGKAQDARQVVEMVSLISGKPLGDRKTLLFFDEVQKAQNIVTISKYLLEDGRFDVAMSGSMLGVELTEVKNSAGRKTFLKWCLTQPALATAVRVQFLTKSTGSLSICSACTL